MHENFTIIEGFLRFQLAFPIRRFFFVNLREMSQNPIKNTTE